MTSDFKETMLFKLPEQEGSKVKDIISKTYIALKEKDYDPINQISGYLQSGDPTYITSHNNARKLIRMVDMDDLLKELIVFYIEKNNIG